jgi:UDP-glucose 4-epimerase
MNGRARLRLTRLPGATSLVRFVFFAVPNDPTGSTFIMSELCLVTGGAGFIGSHLVEGLTAVGQRVRVFDDFSTGQESNLAQVSPAPEIIRGDLTDAGVVSDAVAGCDLVFHLGALASVQLGLEQPARMHAVGATGTLNVLDAASKHGVRRVVYAGSASAYGIPEGEVQSEDTPLCPLSTYAAAKLAGEMYCVAFAASHGVETVRLRFFNIFGPRQRADSPYSGVIAIFAALMAQGKTPTVFGDGLQSRDFTYVGDVVEALGRAASAPPTVSGKVFNVGTGKSVTLLELVDALNRLLGTSLQARHAPARTGDIRHSRADVTRLKQGLGYEARVAFEEGLRATVVPSGSASHP